MKRSCIRVFIRFFLLTCSLLTAAAYGQTIQQFTDRAAIAAQVARYSYAADGKDLEAFTALFTEDAVWQSIPPGTDKPSIIMHSREEIRKFSAV